MCSAPFLWETRAHCLVRERRECSYRIVSGNAKRGTLAVAPGWWKGRVPGRWQTTPGAFPTCKGQPLYLNMSWQKWCLKRCWRVFLWSQWQKDRDSGKSRSCPNWTKWVPCPNISITNTGSTIFAQGLQSQLSIIYAVLCFIITVWEVLLLYEFLGEGVEKRLHSRTKWLVKDWVDQKPSTCFCQEVSIQLMVGTPGLPLYTMALPFL